MKKFKYTATNLYGKKFRGVFLAEDEDDLRAQLAKQNLFLVDSKITSDKSPSRFFSVTGKVSINELCTFCRQFSILVESGTFIIDALNILRNQSYSSYLKKVLELVYEDVKSGKLLSEALAKHKNTFPNFFVSMIRIGESSGQINQVLVTVA
ncbi:MAG: type II secretion system F family protein, partial [Candidatus Fimimonas sp.]